MNELSERVKITPTGLVISMGDEEEIITTEPFEMAHKTFQKLVNAFTKQRNGNGLVIEFDLAEDKLISFSL